MTTDGEDQVERGVRGVAHDPWRLPIEIAGYRFLGLIGRGGMGTIYRAQQIGMDRPVAVKVLRPDFAENEVYVERLKREARVAGRLDHANIVKGIEVGESDGRHYFVMEYVEGKSLKTILKEQGSLDEEEVIELGLQIARGLQHAHREGVVHRDIKPSNILVSSTGVGKLADLGLARRAEDPSLTQDGATVGTPQYMAPEQATDSSRADPRSDLYSLGATLFHAATGRPPYEAESIGPLLTKLLHEPVPDPLSFQPDLSQGLALVLRKTLAKNPAERYSTATELIADLLRVRNHLPPRVDPDHDDDGRVGRVGFRLMIVAACVVLAAVVLLVVLTRETPRERPIVPPDRPSVRAELVQLELDIEAAPGDPAWLERIVALGARLGTLDDDGPEVRAQALTRINELHRKVMDALSSKLEEAEAAFRKRVDERLVGDPFAPSLEKELFQVAWREEVEERFPRQKGRPVALTEEIERREKELRDQFPTHREAAIRRWIQQRLTEVERSFEDPRMESALAFGRFVEAENLLRDRGEALKDEFESKLSPELRIQAIEKVVDVVAEQRRQVREIARQRVERLIEDMRRKRHSLEDAEVPSREEEFHRFFRFFEDLGLDSAEELPPVLRSGQETNPFLLRERFESELKALDEVERARNSQHRWEAIVRGAADALIAQRRYAAALDYLDEAASQLTDPAVLEHLKDRRAVTVRLRHLARDVSAVLNEAHEAGRTVALRLRDGQVVRGVPQAPVESAAMEIDLGRRGGPVRYAEVARGSLLELAAPALEERSEDPRELDLLLHFYDALGTPAIAEVLQRSETLEPGPFKVMLQGWTRTAYDDHRSLSGGAIETVEKGLASAKQLAAEGRHAEALAALEEVESAPEMKGTALRGRYGQEFEDLAAAWRRALEQDEIQREIEAKVPGAVVELVAGEGPSEDVYSVVLDLSKRSVLSGLRCSGDKDWDVDEYGFFRLEEARKMRDLAKGPSFDLRFGSHSFDFGHPVSLEITVRCLEEEGVPFFFATVAGSWTFGFLTGGMSPDLQQKTFHLVEAAEVGRRGARAFAMPGTSLDAFRGKLPAAHEKGPQGRSVPFGGFLRGVTHRVRIDILEKGRRVRLSLDGELLIDAPAQTRLRDRLEFRAWDRVRLRELRVTGRLK